MSEFMKSRSSELTDILDSSSQYPGIAMGEDKKLFVCWQEYKNRHDAVYAGRLESGQVRDKRKISGEGEALRPVICSFRDAIWYAWSETAGKGWQILARYMKVESAALS